MVPNCKGCKCEYEEGLKYLKQGCVVTWHNYKHRGHLSLVRVQDLKTGEIIIG